jgi:hypothetical protein
MTPRMVGNTVLRLQCMCAPFPCVVFELLQKWRDPIAVPDVAPLFQTSRAAEANLIATRRCTAITGQHERAAS